MNNSPVSSSTKSHGGARKGAGRKPPLGQATVRKTIRLTPNEWDQLAKFHPIFSQAIRAILELAHKVEQEKQK